jgi:hypothetical protein
MNYKVEVNDTGLMIGKPILINGYVPKQKKVKDITPDANMQSEINSIEL